MNNSPRSQIEEAISQVVTGLTDHSIIQANDVANRVNKYLDPDNKSPNLTAYSSMMHLRQLVGKYLARQYDPETKAQEMLAGQQDMLSGELQTMYPVKRSELGKDSAYIEIDLLTDDECRDIANKCFKIGDTYHTQGELMLSYVNTRNVCYKPAH